MATKDVKVTEIEVVNGNPVVRGTAADIAFEAAPFRWGSKMLMKVEAEGLDRGTRIAVGHAAKKALRTAGHELPAAVLKRPRKAKEVVVAEVVIEVEVEEGSEA